MFGNNETNICPLIKKPCIKHNCAWYVNVQGENPNTGEKISNSECVVTFLPWLIMDTTKGVRETASAAQETRNEVERSRTASNARAEETMKLLLAQLHQARIEPAKVVIENE
jgi:hypothetical protein